MSLQHKHTIWLYFFIWLVVVGIGAYIFLRTRPVNLVRIPLTREVSDVSPSQESERSSSMVRALADYDPALDSHDTEDQNMSPYSTSLVDDDSEIMMSESVYDNGEPRTDSQGCVTNGVFLHSGEGCFIYYDDGGNEDSPVPVWYYRPETFTDSSRVVFLMHGHSRDAQGLRDDWQDIADGHHAFILAPEFSTQYFPKEQHYGRGNVEDDDGIIVPASDWTYSTVEEIFNVLQKEKFISQKQYSIAGHSAGAQFVHRMMLLKPHAHIDTAVIANAGWYLLPDRDENYPNGIANLLLSDNDLKKSYVKTLIILAGTLDTDPDAVDLNHSDWAEIQGAHRYDRAHYFYDYMLGRAPTWRIVDVPGVAHSASDMLPAIAEALFGNRIQW